jgi:hypothetical protein
MNIGPKPRFLFSIRAERGDVVRLCSEAVDNSFDAGARSVSITISRDAIGFVDDGIGVALKNFPALFTLGDHAQLTSTKLGRFGVGITAQAVNVANEMTVRSISADGCFTAQVDWREVLRDGWTIEEPVRLPFVVGTPTGTVITLTGLRPLVRYTLERLIDDLAQRFYPALAEGRTITVNGIPVPVLADPPMNEVVEHSFQFGEGRSATLRGGLLAQPSKLNRVNIGYGHRIVMPLSTFGCGGFTGLSNLFARVQLGGYRWALSAYKEGITDESQRDELEEAVAAALQPILQKCGNVSMETRVMAIGELVNELLPDSIAAARPHKQKGKEEPSGKKGRRSPSGEVDAAKSDPGGPARTRRPQNDRLLITFEGRNDENGLGWFEPGRPARVNLSPDNPKLAQLVHHKDDRIVALAIMIIGVILFEVGREESDPQLEIRFEPIGVRIAKHLMAALEPRLAARASL